jgi:NhaP-type Na+/H+ or K+/H+ antiporter
MAAIAVFSIALLAATLFSGAAQRTVFATTVLFLIAGFFAGNGMLDILHVDVQTPLMRWLANLALVTVLFTEGMRLSASELRSAWRLPGRALILGLPLTLVIIAIAARILLELDWTHALLVAAVLSPTDPVFASAIVERASISYRLRRLLNVESGLNDGLALPIVLVLLGVAGAQAVGPAGIALELVLGVAIGIGVPWICAVLARSRHTFIEERYRPLFALAVGLLTLSACEYLHGNRYLAAFAAGITLTSVGSELAEAFQDFGETLAEVFKLAAVMVFGALISPAILTEVSASDYVFAGAVLLVARPLGMLIALLRSRLSIPERIVAAWFGPKGFASVVYAILIVQAGVANGVHLFHVIVVVIAASILAHSSTDVPLGRWLGNKTEGPAV